MTDPLLDNLLAQARADLQAGQRTRAADLCRQVLARDARHAAAHATLGEIALLDRQFAAAESHLNAAVEGDPRLLTAASNLAVLYRHTGRPERGRDLLRQVLAQAPDFAEAWLNLGNALQQLQDYDAAMVAFEKVLQLRPNYVRALVRLAWANRMALCFDRCLECLRQAVEREPAADLYSSLLFLGMYSPNVSPEQLAAWADEWDRRFAQFSALPHSAQMDPERPLRVGYVTSALRGGSIGVMVEPLVAGHDRQRFLPYCYSDTTAPDAVTERFRAHAQQFRETASLNDEQLGQLIRADQIDILIDLNLHTDRSRLLMFARRPAPVQVTYLAYPFTGGLRAMDYRVTDAVLDPPGQPTLGPEALLRLRGCYWIYRPSPEAPLPSAALPARSAGRITFANLNLNKKLNAAAAAAWAAILNRTPGSCLVQVVDHPPSQTGYVTRIFADAGLDPARLVLVGPVPHEQYLALHREVDLCLDPFPYGGHTTALDALWMGVPVVTLAGRAPYMRGAASMLTHLGLTELIAHSVEEYQTIAVTLANDLGRLENLRQGLRERMRSSVLCDEKRFVADFERGLRLAWQRYCQGHAPEQPGIMTP